MSKALYYLNQVFHKIPWNIYGDMDSIYSAWLSSHLINWGRNYYFWTKSRQKMHIENIFHLILKTIWVKSNLIKHRNRSFYVSCQVTLCKMIRQHFCADFTNFSKSEVVFRFLECKVRALILNPLYYIRRSCCENGTYLRVLFFPHPVSEY